MLPGNSSVNTVQLATIEEAVCSVDPTDAPLDRVDSDHVMFTVGPCPFRGYVSKTDRIRSGQLRVIVAAEARAQPSKQ
jgi:hypothetical protein